MTTCCTAQGRRAHVKRLPTLKSQKTRATATTHCTFILFSRSLCCQVRWYGPPELCCYGGATVMSNSLVYSLSVRLSFTCQCQPLIFAWVETSQPTTYCKCVVYSTSPKTTPFGARPATRNTKSGRMPPATLAQYQLQQLLKSPFLLFSCSPDHLSGWWVGTPGSGPRRAPTCTPVDIRKS